MKCKSVAATEYRSLFPEAGRNGVTAPAGAREGSLWAPQLGRAHLRLGRHGAEPSGLGSHRGADFGRAE